MNSSFWYVFFVLGGFAVGAWTATVKVNNECNRSTATIAKIVYTTGWIKGAQRAADAAVNTKSRCYDSAAFRGYYFSDSAEYAKVVDRIMNK